MLFPLKSGVRMQARAPRFCLDFAWILLGFCLDFEGKTNHESPNEPLKIGQITAIPKIYPIRISRVVFPSRVVPTKYGILPEYTTFLGMICS